MLANLVHLLGLPVIRNMGTMWRFEAAQIAAWPRLARERGNLQTISGMLPKVNLDRLNQCVAECVLSKVNLNQCVADQLSECTGRTRLQAAAIAARPSFTRDTQRRRPRGCTRRNSLQWYSKSRRPSVRARRSWNRSRYPQRGPPARGRRSM